MADELESVTVQAAGLTLSQIVWRRVKSPAPGEVEAILEANRHLADAGFVLPVGTVVLLPPRASKSAQEQVAPAIRLW